MSRPLHNSVGTRRCVAALVGAALISTAACDELTEQQTHMFQICLKDQKNVEAFIVEMRGIAQAYQLEFEDISGIVSDTNRIGGSSPPGNGPVIELSASASDGFAIVAAASGLRGFQVSVGFTEGSDRPRSLAIMDASVSRFKARWRIEAAPPDSGAIPFSDCF